MYEQPEKKRKRRPTPPLTVNWLCAEAVSYLQRWTASEARVERVLWRRIKRAQSFHGGTPEEAKPLIGEVMARLRQMGMVDDDRFARLWVDSLRRRGTSKRMIYHKLREKGVSAERVTCALEAYESDEEGDPERLSATAYAKRRRLGPFRQPFDDCRERWRKDLASMARAGFSYDVARSVLEAEEK